MRMLFPVLIALALALSLVPAASGQTSTGSISLQAKLDGVAAGPVNLTVQFYDALSGGNAVGSHIAVSGVPVNNGIVSVPVTVDPGVFNGNTRYVGISVNGGAELSPRTLVTSVPYAITTSDVQEDAVLRIRSLSVLRPDGQASIVIGRTTDPGTGTAGFFRLTGEGGFLDFESSQDAVTWSKALRITSQRRLECVRPDGAGVVVLGRSAGPQTGYARIVGENGFLEFQTSPDNTDPTWTKVMRLENDGRTIVKVLTITGGSDLAEPFAAAPDQPIEPKPGVIMSIDPDHPGALRVATEAYDTRVAGVYSGGNGLPTGMVMGKQGCDLTAPGEDRLPLAMTGRVWVFADDTGGVIKPGDRLTTSGHNPGHAMKATDAARTDGAVIGKAMTPRDEKSGMVLVLVNLQ